MEPVIQGEDKGQRQQAKTPCSLARKEGVNDAKQRTRQCAFTHEGWFSRQSSPMIRKKVKKPRRSLSPPLQAFAVKGPPPSLPFSSSHYLHIIDDGSRNINVPLTISLIVKGTLIAKVPSISVPVDGFKTL